MTDNTEWFYAQDGTEHGPVTAKALRELAQKGDLAADQLTWHEGMDDWVPAGEIRLLKGLFPPLPPMVDARPEDTSMASRAAAKRAPKLPQVTMPGDPRRLVRLIGIPVLLFGVVLVVLARGSDRLGDRGVERTRAKSEAAQIDFNTHWDDRQVPLEAKIRRLEEQDGIDIDEEKQLREWKEELATLKEDRQKARDLIEVGEWRQMQLAASNASRNNVMWSYWREWLFVLGSIFLICGLIAVGFTGEGPERTICLTMLAIITFSIFVGGWDGGAWDS